MTEAQFQDMVAQAARNLGWAVSHFRRAIARQGKWATPASYDAVGFPDCIFLHPDHGLIFVEFKTNRGTLRPEQRRWAELLEAAGQDIRIWRPRDWDVEVLPTLKGET